MSRHASDPTAATGTSIEELDRLLDGSSFGGRDPNGLRSERVIVGRLLSFVEHDLALVAYQGQPSGDAIPARLAVDLDARHIGYDVVLQFEDGDPLKPIVTAWIRKSKVWPDGDVPPHVHVEADGQKLTVDAREEITLRCGKASITLTKAGKVLIQGTYVSSRATGINRIKGGSVQLN